MQVMCWVLGVAEKLSPLVHEAGATSGACVRALAALAGACAALCTTATVPTP